MALTLALRYLLGRQILDHIGEPSTAPIIAAARPPLKRTDCAPVLAAPETTFEAIPELEFVQMADLDGEASHDPLMHAAD